MGFRRRPSSSSIGGDISTTTATTMLQPLELRAPEDDGFLPVTATRGRGTTKASAAFLLPETVGIPHQKGIHNAFAAFDDALSVATPDRPGDELRPVEGRKAMDTATIQAVVNKSFDDFYGPDAPSDPTSLRLKGLFNDGARMVDRILTDISEEQKRHEERTTQQLVGIHESDVSARSSLRADVTTLQSETDDALLLLRRETTEALDRLLQETTATASAAIKLIMQPTITSIEGLTATANKLEVKVTDLSESFLVLRRDLDRGGDLADLAALEQQSEQAVIGLMATTEKNAQAIRDLRLELAGCASLPKFICCCHCHRPCLHHHCPLQRPPVCSLSPNSNTHLQRWWRWRQLGAGSSSLAAAKAVGRRWH